MEPKVNFLLAVLGGVIIISMAMSLRNCGRRPPLPAYFDRTVSIDSAIEQARRENLAVFAVFGARWCPVCTEVKEGPLSSGSVQAWVDDYAIPVYVDVTKARSGDLDSKVLMTRYQVSELPTIMLLVDGKELKRVTGDIPRRELMKWLRAYSEPPQDGN